MAEADKAGRQDVEEEAAEKGVGVHSHLLQRIAVTPVAIREADLAIADIDEAGIGDGNAMGVAADIVDDLGRTCKGGFRIHHPRGGVEVVKEVRKALGGG